MIEQNNNPLISIIIPVYNVEDYLRMCIDSIIKQHYIHWELYLIDDGSKDKSPEICDEYAAIDDRIKVIHKANGGQSSARNLALDLIKGEYCTFIDSDDFVHEHYLDYLLGMCLNNDADLAQCTFVRGDDNGYRTNPMSVSHKDRVYTNRTIFESTDNNVIVCGKLYKTYLWNDIRMPEGRIYEDHAVAWRLYYAASRIVVTDKPLYYYRYNQESTMLNKKRKYNIDLPISDYHERIGFFDTKNDKHMSDLSKWRYSKFLMTTMGSVVFDKEEKARMNYEFRSIYKDVLFCKNVPLSNKVLIILTLISPTLVDRLIRLIRK